MKKIDMALTAVILLAFPIMAFAGYLYGKNSSESFATLNLNRVVQAHETLLASKDLSATELQTQTESFARKLKSEIDRMQADCQCNLLVSNAVISPSKLPDLTDELFNRLGISETELIKAEVLVKERLKTAGLVK